MSYPRKSGCKNYKKVSGTISYLSKNFQDHKTVCESYRVVLSQLAGYSKNSLEKDPSHGCVDEKNGRATSFAHFRVS